ncbi:MAG: hypothetical protein ABI318_22475 [Chthoniobacteraceae bacterium]
MGLLMFALAWPLVVLTIVVVLCRELRALLDGLIAKLKQVTGVKAGSVGLKFGEPITIKTAVGRINVSAIQTTFESHSNVFRSGP